MHLPEGWRELIERLNSHGVEYLIVGAFAPAFHGFPGYTGDIDLLVRRSPDNAGRLEAALGQPSASALPASLPRIFWRLTGSFNQESPPIASTC